MPRKSIVAAPSDDRTRQQILNAAARLIREQGYAVTTLRQIAEAAGIQAGSIYYHFASKEDLLVEVLDTGMRMVADAVRERVDALPPGAPSRDKIAAAIHGHLLGLLAHGDFTTANTRSYNQLPESVKKRHRGAQREYAAYWESTLEEALEKGDLRKDVPIPIQRMFILGALNWTVEWYSKSFGSVDRFAEHICKIVFEGILVNDKQRRRAAPGS